MEIDKLEEIIEKLYITNNSLRKQHSGLYTASTGEHYSNYVWIRDTYYQTKPNLNKNPEAYIQTYRSLLDYHKGLNYHYENKVDNLIRRPFPLNNIRFIHPRFYPNLLEITGDWGNLQLDAIGYFFLGISEGIRSGLSIIRDDSDVDIINKLIKVLLKIKYWTIADNGIWEESEEVHASSIGAVVSGLKALDEIEFIVPQKLISEGEKVLNKILPMESTTKEVDLSLLTLMYPFNIVSEENKSIILSNIHEKLERNNGVCRYIGDKYYNISGEAEWTFGFSYLSIIYMDNNQIDLAEKYINKILSTIDNEGNIPELFFSNTTTPNDNNPLGWSVAMAILAIEKYIETKKLTDK